MVHLGRRATAGVMASLLLGSPGCLSSSYRVAPDELARLARVDPALRWQSVRVTQLMIASSHPPPNARVVPGTPGVVIVPGVLWFRGRARWLPGTARGASVGRAASGARGGSSGSHGNGRPNPAAAVAVAVLAAAGIVFVLAATEGARYDGWVGVPPDEPVYLEVTDGTVLAVPLSALTPELAAAALRATIYEGSTERFARLERAPLNRAGFAVQSGVVGALIPRAGGRASVFGGGARAFFGGFPVRALGVGASADVLAGVDGALLATVGAEAQVMPLLWAGAYLGAGGAWLTPGQPGPNASGWFVRGGAQLELPVTTRFAASLRAGAAYLSLDGAQGAAWMPELSLGLSVY